MAAVLAFAMVPAIRAASVFYSPAQVEVEGNMPYSQPSTFRIFKPADVTTATVTLSANADAYPMGTADEAVSYISFSPSTVTFAANETSKVVTVTATFPNLNVPPDTTLVFQYKVLTSGWGVPVSDAGMNISATVTAPPPSGAGLPIITITAPTESVYTYSATELPASIPFAFQAATASPSTIFSIDATINGLPITFEPSGTGTVLATGTGSLPISGPGVYTIVARGANAQGNAETSKTITVIVDGPPPEVVIASPAINSDYTHFVGGSPARVPVSFTATTPSGTSIQSLSATLNGTPLPGAISITGGALNTQSVTGTIPLDLTVSGQYTLGVKAFNQYGDATTTSTFWINRVANPASQTVYTGSSATFSVVATGVPNFTYQWTRQAAGTVGFVPIVDGGFFTGATTATLSISNAAMGMNGDKFQCLITGFSTVASAPATLTVLKRTPVLTWGPPAPITYGTALSGTQLNATANVVGNFVYAPAADVVLSAGVQPLQVSFVPTDTANYNNASATVDLLVNKAVLTVAASSVSKVYGAAIPALTYGVSGFVNGDTAQNAFTGAAAIGTSATAASPVGGYDILVGPGNLASSNYDFAFQGSRLTITKASQAITFSAPGTKTVGDAAFNLGASVNSPLLLSYASSNGAVAIVAGTGTVTIAGAGVTLLTVSQPGDSNYEAAASVVQSLTVNAATSLAPTIVINYPTSADVILPVGQLTTNLNFRFTSTPQSGSSIDAVASAFDSVSVSSSTTPTLPTTQVAVSTGTIINVGAGVHTFTASARSGTASASASVSFRVIVTEDPAPACGTAIVRHSAVMNGNAGIEGSLQIMLSEDMALNGNAWISGDLLLPGTPSLRLNERNATVGSQIEGSGSASPSGAKLTLNGNALITRLVRRTNPVSLPVVAAPPASTGSRSVKLNKSSDSVGSFATLRDLTINGNIGLVAVAPGTYRDFTVNGSSNGLILGVAGATEPSVYNFRNLALNGRTEVKVVGPVVITVANAVAFNGEFGNADHTGWATLRIADGGLTLNGAASFFGTVIAPNGTVALNGLDVLKGGLASDRLVINGQGLVDLCDGDGSPQIDDDDGGGDHDCDRDHGDDDDEDCDCDSGDRDHDDDENRSSDRRKRDRD